MIAKPGKQGQKYVGFEKDITNGMTTTVKIILDARVFGLIKEDENCDGWLAAGVLALQDKVADAWDRNGFLPSRLPDELRERHTRIYKQAVEDARTHGWDPDKEIEEKHR
ncbi:MAG: hypothetical protein L3J67_01045 [Hyphomicrobiaceae bacterium]|nr:hypothetical protein [Hyphomicrobiaceae bacterium]